MPCSGRYDDWIAEDALGAAAELSAGQKAELQAHLERCGRCRQKRRETLRLIDLVRDEPESEVPEEVLRATHENVMRAVRQRHRRVEFGRTLPWLSGAVAASILAGGGLWLVFSPSDTGAGARVGQWASAPASSQAADLPAPTPPVGGDAGRTRSALVAAFERAAGAAEALALLQGAFEAAKANQREGDLREILSLCDGVISRWNDTPEGLEARKLIARCHEQMGGPVQAHAAFLAYADEAGARYGRHEQHAKCASGMERAGFGVTSTLILGEARRLLDSRDYLPSIAYADLLIMRYPDTEVAREARALVGVSHLLTRQPDEAVAVFQSIIDEAPNGPAARNVATILPSALFNAGRPEAAAKAWICQAERCSNADERARGYYNAAALLSAYGERFHSESRALFRRVIEQYPTSPDVAQARVALERFEQELQRQRSAEALEILHM